MANYRFADTNSTTLRPPGAGTTLTQRVYDSLRDEIISGQLRPGDRLVRRAVGRRLGVSQIPVCEALLKLEGDGLVENLPLYGARVRTLTHDDVQNDQVLREAIECQAARVASGRATDKDLGRLLTLARRVDRLMAQGDPGSKVGAQAHLDFHLAVAQAGGYTSLADELQRVWFRRLMRLSWLKATQYRPVPADWHEQLVAAIAGRDPDRAEAAMRHHVQYGSEDDRRALEQFKADQDG